jgi:sec-independent protein translocase protein TatC
MDDARLPLTEHLAELRRRIVRALLFWAAGMGIAWWFREEIFRELLRPAVAALAEEGGHLQAIAPGEIFFTYLKGAALGGFVLALPAVLWQAWAFIAPGLYPGEKKMAVPFVVISTLLFVTGALFGHQFVFPPMFTFLGGFESEFVRAAWSMREVWSMTTSMFLAFGVAFELPVVVFFLAVAGILNVKQLLRYFPYAILVNFVIGAVLTPSPDWVSQSMLAVPMCVLYLLGVLVAYLFGGKRARGTTEIQQQATVTSPS